MEAIVIANRNFTSSKMSVERAVIFARTLEERGNQNVRVIPLDAREAE